MEDTVTRSDLVLRQKGIKASFQRVLIFDYLLHTKEHPSVSQIFTDLRTKIPGLSRATVYNTIHLFVDRNLVVPVNLEGTESRYDLRDPSHAHFHCNSCGTIFDIPVELVELPQTLKDFEVTEAILHFKGTCPRCR